MNPQSISTKKDNVEARKEYINNLRLEVSNLQRVKNARDALESTGQTISAPADNRTQLEIYADLAKIKIILQEKLNQIMDGNNAIQTISELSRDPSALRYTVNRIVNLIPYFQGKYKLGTPYLVFLNYIRTKMRALSEEEKRSYGFSFTAKDSEQPSNPKVEKEKGESKKESKSTTPTPTKKTKLTLQGQKRKRLDDEDGSRKKPKVNIVGSGIETLNAKKKILLDRLRTDDVKHLTVTGIKQKYTAKKIQALKTERQIDKLYNKYKPSQEIKKKTGNIIFGEGLKVGRKPVNLDKEKAVVPKETYSQFGRYLINNHRLNDDILMIRSKKGGGIPSLPTQKVSKGLIKAVSKIVNGKTLDYEDINELNEDEKEHLGNVVSKSHLADKFKIPKTCKIDAENNRFEILKGEILAGNNSPTAIKEFKLLIVKLMNQNRLPRRQGTEILTDLTTLGF